MVHAWDQAAFSDSEPEEDGGLPHEIPQPVFRERDLNRSLDYDILNQVNRYFERLFDLADQRLIYRQVEEATVNAQADVFAILTNIIACQQQHTEANLQQIYAMQRISGNNVIMICMENLSNYSNAWTGCQKI